MPGGDETGERSLLAGFVLGGRFDTPPPPYVAGVSSRISDLRGDPKGKWLILYVVTGMIWERKGLRQGWGIGSRE
jgi:hypothetical protein